MRRLAGVLLAVTLLGGCDVFGIDDPVEGDLREQRAAWVAQNHRNYTYEFQRSCFCGETRRMVITVRNDAVTSVVVKGTGEPVTQFLDSYYTITRLYDYLIDVAEDASSMEVLFDTSVHIPVSVSADPIENAVDDEFDLQLSNFTVISP
jgi:hypothetical protein